MDPLRAALQDVVGGDSHRLARAALPCRASFLRRHPGRISTSPSHDSATRPGTIDDERRCPAAGPKHRQRDMADNSTRRGVDSLAFLAGGGDMGRRIREFDWSANPLGPIEGWPQSLRSALGICLNSNFPIAIYWGSDLGLLYNDEWSPIPGEKHPWALGRPAREAWPEIWHIIEPLFQRVMATGAATRSRDQLLPMHRHGFTEE